MTTDDNMLAEVKRRNESVNKRLSLSIQKLKEKLEKQNESLRTIINAGDILNLFEPDNVYETLSEYENFGMVIGKDRTLLIYHQPNTTGLDVTENAQCMASISEETVTLTDYRGTMSAYRAIEIYDRLCDDIEGLVRVTLRDILIRYERMNKKDEDDNMVFI